MGTPDGFGVPAPPAESAPTTIGGGSIEVNTMVRSSSIGSATRCRTELRVAVAALSISVLVGAGVVTSVPNERAGGELTSVLLRQLPSAGAAPRIEVQEIRGFVGR